MNLNDIKEQAKMLARGGSMGYRYDEVTKEILEELRQQLNPDPDNPEYEVNSAGTIGIRVTRKR